MAIVVAESREIAEDAMLAIEAQYTPLPVVVDTASATKHDAPQLHANAPHNINMIWTVGDREGTAKAIDSADVVVRQKIVNQRLIPNAMEAARPRSALATTRAPASTRSG